MGIRRISTENPKHSFRLWMERASSPPPTAPGTCELKVVTPFGSAPDLTFSLPWSIIDFYYPDMTQLMPDQDLIFAGVPANSLSDIPPIVDQYPNWDFIDNPVFRLSPNGQSRLIGFTVPTPQSTGSPFHPMDGITF